MLIDFVTRNGIIMPVYQSTAPKHDQYGTPPYTVFANFLDVSLPTLSYVSVLSAYKLISSHPPLFPS